MRMFVFFLLIYQFYRNDVTKRRNVNVTRSLAETYSQGRKWSRNGCSFFLLSPHTRCVTRSGRLGVTAPLYLPDSHRIILEVSNKMVARRCAEHRSSFLSIDREFSRLVSTIHFRQIFSIERIEKYILDIKDRFRANSFTVNDHSRTVIYIFTSNCSSNYTHRIINSSHHFSVTGEPNGVTVALPKYSTRDDS